MAVGFDQLLANHKDADTNDWWVFWSSCYRIGKKKLLGLQVQLLANHEDGAAEGGIGALHEYGVETKVMLRVKLAFFFFFLIWLKISLNEKFGFWDPSKF